LAPSTPNPQSLLHRRRIDSVDQLTQAPEVDAAEAEHQARQMENGGIVTFGRKRRSSLAISSHALRRTSRRLNDSLRHGETATGPIP
jgi:Spy/CpxP family protein refolding chaperone